MWFFQEKPFFFLSYETGNYLQFLESVHKYLLVKLLFLAVYAAEFLKETLNN